MKSITLRITFFLVCSFFSSSLYSQIVDIESSRKEDLIGTKISINLGLDGSSGTVDRQITLLEQDLISIVKIGIGF